MFFESLMTREIIENRHFCLAQAKPWLIGAVSVFFLTWGGNAVFGQIPGYSVSRTETASQNAVKGPTRSTLVPAPRATSTLVPAPEAVSTTTSGSPQNAGQMRGQNPSLLDNISFIFKKDKDKENNVRPANGTPMAAGDKDSMTTGEAANGMKILRRRPLAERIVLDRKETTAEPQFAPVKTEMAKTAMNESTTENHPVLGKELPLEKPTALVSDDFLSKENSVSENLSVMSESDLVVKGDHYFDANLKDKAEAYYRERIARSQTKDGLEESLVPIYHRLGLIVKEQGNYQEAQELLVLAIKSDPKKNPEITFDYAKILYEAQKYDRAKKLFTYLTETHPEMDGPRYHIGLCLLNTDPGDEALAYLEETLGREKACRMVAEKSRELGRVEVAEKMEGILQNEFSAGRESEPLSLSGNSEENLALLEMDDKKNGADTENETPLLLNGSDRVKLGALEDQDSTLETLGLDREQTTHVNSPVINIETLGPKRIMVGQESEYKIIVENKSGQTASNLTVQTDIPDGVDITGVSPTSGNSRIGEKENGSGELACLWNLGNFEPNRKETLVFKFTPRVRNNIDFTTHYDYEKTVLKSGIEVTEPVLELAIEGSDVIEWGAEEKYRMKLRNTGDGEAKNIRLTVATGDNDNATRIIKTLAPGEEKTLEINLKTVLDGTLVVRADAEADFGFGADAEKMIDILRGRLDLFVEVPEVQFVNESTDYLVHVCNTGQADLRDVEVVAAIPTSIEVVSTSGNAVRNNATNQLVWKIASIKPEEEIIYQVNAKMLRAGSSRMDVTAADKTGVSGAGEALVQVEAIAALEMKINKPTGAIALGKEVEYEVVINNSGTKAAEEIDAGFFLPTGMTPVSVDGGGMVIPEESKVLFNKINFLGPGQTVAYKVRVVGEMRGNHKVQAVLESKADNVQLVREEMNFFYDNKTAVARRDNAPNARVAMNTETVRRPDAPATPAKMTETRNERTAQTDQAELATDQTRQRGETNQTNPTKPANLTSQAGQEIVTDLPQQAADDFPILLEETPSDPMTAEIVPPKPSQPSEISRQPVLELPANLPGPRVIHN